jgi:hypothetical protein
MIKNNVLNTNLRIKRAKKELKLNGWYYYQFEKPENVYKLVKNIKNLSNVSEKLGFELVFVSDILFQQYDQIKKYWSSCDF